MENGEKKIIHYDKILKNLFNISNRLTIYAINALFKKNFHEDTKIEQLKQEYIRPDKTSAIADTVLKIEIDAKETKYHIEFQTLNDRTIVIRMIDYGFRIAIDNLDYNKIKTDQEITVEFPSQTVIFLKQNQSIPDQLKLSIKMPYTEQIIKYIVPAFKVWEHDPGYYKRQKLYIMLPLRIINLHDELEGLKERRLQEEEKTKQLNKYRKKIRETIEDIIIEIRDALTSNELIIEECNKILLELSTLAGELYSEEIKDMEQEVNEMAKMIIDPEIYRRGLEEGKAIINQELYKRGLEEGKAIINQELYKRGLEEGIEKGVEKGVGKGIAETIIKQLRKKLGELPREYKERILGQDRPTLELIAENVFDIGSLSDLDRFLKQ